jgi:SAM-dependent methyltransferase/4-amino-4-deoxy-L-arabinose transferase-like glycosyltransferase
MTERRVLFTARDYITGSLFEIDRCHACGLVRTVPQPPSSQLGRYYPPGYYGLNQRYPRPLEWLLERLYAARARAFSSAAGGGPGRVVDIGCGRGQLLNQLRALGWKTTGTELSEESARYARDVLGLDVRVGEIQELSLEGSYDLVIMWHVLEHVRDPGRALQEVARILAPGGVVVVAVPNFSSWEARLGRSGWFHLDVPRHLNHFTPSSLAGLLGQAQLEGFESHFLAVEYDSFSFAQTLLNVLGFRHNLVYDVLRSRGAKLLSDRSSAGASQSAWAIVCAVCLLWISPLWMALVVVLRRGATMTVHARRVIEWNGADAPNMAPGAASTSDDASPMNSDPPRPDSHSNGAGVVGSSTAESAELSRAPEFDLTERARQVSAIAKLPGLGPLLTGVVAVVLAFIGQNILTPDGHPGPNPDITAAVRWYASGMIVLLMGWWGSYRNEPLVHYPPVPRWIPWIAPMRLILCALALLADGLSLLVLRRDWASGTGEILWLVSLVLLIAAFTREPNDAAPKAPNEPEHPWRLPPRAEFAAFTAIMVFAAVMRLWRLGDLSEGMHGDEGEAGTDALGILQGVNSALFERGWFNQPNMYYWSLAICLKLFGSGLFGLRMFALLCGLVTVAFTYLIGREMFGRRGAIIAGAFMAFGSAGVLFSREEFSNASTPALIAVAFYFVLRGLRTRRHLDFILSGLAAALNLYFYAGGRIAGPMLLVLFAYLTLLHPRFVKHYWTRVAAWTAGFGLMSIPFAAYLVAFPITGTQYPNDRFIWLHHADLAALYGSNAWPTIIWDQLQASLSVLTLKSDASAMGALNYPIARPIEAAFILLGLAWAVWRLFDTRFFILSLWFWASVFVAGVLTIDAPNLPRLMAMLPVLPLVLAAVLDHLIEQLSTMLDYLRLPPSWVKARWVAGAAVAVAVVALAGFQNWNMYIGYYLNTHQDAIVSAQAAYVQQQGPTYRFYNMGAPLLYWTYGDNRFINPRADGIDAGNPSAYLPFIDNGVLGKKAVNVLVWTPMYDYLPVLRSYYPSGTTQTVHIGDARQPQQSLIGFVVPHAQIDAQRFLFVTFVDASGRRVRTRASVLGLLSGKHLPARLKYPVTVTWNGSLYADAFQRYRFHIDATVGTHFTIDDVPVLSLTRAQANRTVILSHGLHRVQLRATLPASGTPVDLTWARGNGPLAPIPNRYLWNGAVGRSWNGEIQTSIPVHHRPGTPPLERRVDGFLGFRNAAQLFGAGPIDGQWSTVLTVPQRGTYGFQVNVTGRVIMTVDNHVVMQGTAPGATPQKFTGQASLGKGHHILDIRVQWSGPFDYLELYWSSPGMAYRIFLSPRARPTQPGVWLASTTSVAG